MFRFTGRLVILFVTMTVSTGLGQLNKAKLQQHQLLEKTNVKPLVPETGKSHDARLTWADKHNKQGIQKDHHQLLQPETDVKKDQNLADEMERLYSNAHAAFQKEYSYYKQNPQPVQTHQENVEEENIIDSASDADHYDDSIRHLVIIGCGAQTVALLVQLKRMIKIPKKLYHISIYEMNKVCGPGLPYSAENVFDEHLLNVILTAQVTITGSDNGNFISWFRKNRDIIDYQLPYSKYSQLEKPAPRNIFGQYLRSTFQDNVKETQNYKIEWKTDTRADSIKFDGSYYAVELSNGRIVRTHDVFLAMGHWPSTLFDEGPDPEGYYTSPWPASTLKSFPADEHFGVIGMGLNGVDAVLSWAHKFGKFIPNKNGFDYDPGSSKFNITMYSRSGRLPGVTGLGDPKAQNYLTITTASDVKEIMHKNGLLPLKKIFKLLKKSLRHLAPIDVKKRLAESWELPIEEFFDQLDQAMYPQTNAQERLEKDMRKVQEIIDQQGGTGLTLQTFYREWAFLFADLVKEFSAEDTIKFKKYIEPRLYKYGVSPMPLHNAKKLLALMNKGRLHIEKVGDGCKFEKGVGNTGVRLVYRNSEKYHRYFVDAVGQSGDLRLHDSNLTRSLFGNDLVKPRYISFSSPGKAKKAFNENKHKKRSRIEVVGGEYVYRADGVDILPREVSSYGKPAIVVHENSNNGVIYASGPFVYGLYPFVRGFDPIIRFAIATVEDIKTRHGFGTPLDFLNMLLGV